LTSADRAVAAKAGKLSDNERRVLRALYAINRATTVPNLLNDRYLDPVLQSREGIHQTAASLDRKGLVAKRSQHRLIWLQVTAAGEVWLTINNLDDREHYEAECEHTEAGPCWWVVRHSPDFDRNGDVMGSGDDEFAARQAATVYNAGRLPFGLATFQARSDVPA
jgi:hypothetical protein